MLDYAVTEIPPEKILMGMPNYGYDWTLPFMRGTPAQSVSLTQAVDLALRYGVEIQFDEQAQTPYFYYTDNGTQHVVWFDDPRSIDAKLQLIDDYRLSGELVDGQPVLRSELAGFAEYVRNGQTVNVKRHGADISCHAKHLCRKLRR